LIRINRSTKQLITFIVVAVLLVATTVATLHILYVKQLKESHKQELNILETELQENTKMAYIPQEDIKKGELLEESKFEKVDILTKAEETYITDMDFGKVALVDIIGGVPVYKSMVAEFVEDDLREEEFNVFYLNTNLKNNDYVDIRIVYPNGENYIVLSKKAIKNVSLQNADCFLWLTAEEIHYISSAIVDAYLNEGTKIYTSKYIEPSVQEQSIVTYMPNQDVLNVIEQDPNVVNVAKETLNKMVREELDSRLSSFYTTYNGEVQWEESAPLEEETEAKEETFYVE